MDAVRLLRTRITGAGIRLELGQWTYGNGRTLQEASDDLVARVTAQAAALRSNGMRIHAEAPMPDLAYLDFLWQLGDLPAGPEGVRTMLFGGGRPES